MRMSTKAGRTALFLMTTIAAFFFTCKAVCGNAFFKLPPISIFLNKGT